MATCWLLPFCAQFLVLGVNLVSMSNCEGSSVAETERFHSPNRIRNRPLKSYSEHVPRLNTCVFAKNASPSRTIKQTLKSWNSALTRSYLLGLLHVSAMSGGKFKVNICMFVISGIHGLYVLITTKVGKESLYQGVYISVWRFSLGRCISGVQNRFSSYPPRSLTLTSGT